MFGGSHAKNMIELVNYLRTIKLADGTPRYDINIMHWPEDNKIKEGENVHSIKFVEYK